MATDYLSRILTVRGVYNPFFGPSNHIACFAKNLNLISDPRVPQIVNDLQSAISATMKRQVITYSFPPLDEHVPADADLLSEIRMAARGLGLVFTEELSK